MFLVVDWALMTDIIPKARAGRYMGISNVATASAGPLGLAVAGVVLFLVTRAGLPFEGAPDLASGLLERRAAGGNRINARAARDRRAHPQGSERDAPRRLTIDRQRVTAAPSAWAGSRNT